MERRAAALLSMLKKEIGGWKEIVPVSGWRSQEEQQGIWDKSTEENGAGFTKIRGFRPDTANMRPASPSIWGAPAGEVDFIRPSFLYSGICETFRQRGGPVRLFIERYPAGKEGITGTAQEPWHLRYVGMPHGEIMAEQGLTLEEYHLFLRQFPLGKIRSFTDKADGASRFPTRPRSRI